MSASQASARAALRSQGRLLPRPRYQRHASAQGQTPKLPRSSAPCSASSQYHFVNCDLDQTSSVQSSYDCISLRTGAVRGGGIRPPQGRLTRGRSRSDSPHSRGSGYGRGSMREVRLPGKLPRIPCTSGTNDRGHHAYGLQDLSTREHRLAVLSSATSVFVTAARAYTPNSHRYRPLPASRNPNTALKLVLKVPLVAEAVLPRAAGGVETVEEASSEGGEKEADEHSGQEVAC